MRIRIYTVYTRPGLSIYKSKFYHGRYECVFWGRDGPKIKQWLRDTFGEHDDMIYVSEDDEFETDGNYGALINDQQLALTILRWS
jgi:hypothetical protein